MWQATCGRLVTQGFSQGASTAMTPTPTPWLPCSCHPRSLLPLPTHLCLGLHQFDIKDAYANGVLALMRCCICNTLDSGHHNRIICESCTLFTIAAAMQKPFPELTLAQFRSTRIWGVTHLRAAGDLVTLLLFQIL